MLEILEPLSKVAVLVFVVTCTVAAGLGPRMGEVLAPLARPRLVALAILANFVTAPAIAYGITEVLPLQHAHAVGLLLLGCAAGAPFLPKLAKLGRGDAAFSIGLMVLLMVVSVAFLPVVLPRLVPGFSAEPWPILRPLLFTMLLPLSAGMAVKSRFPDCAGRLRPSFERVSNVSMLLAVVALVVLNFEALLGTIGSGAILAAILFVSASFGTGFVCGGPDAGTRATLALGTGQRNVAAALLIATQNSDPGVVIMILVSTLAGVAVLLLACACLARWNRTAPVSTSEEPTT